MATDRSGSSKSYIASFNIERESTNIFACSGVVLVPRRGFWRGGKRINETLTQDLQFGFTKHLAEVLEQSGVDYERR